MRQQPSRQIGQEVLVGQVSVKAVSQEKYRQRRHHPANGAASGFQHQQQTDHSQDKVGGSLDTGPVPQRFSVGPEVREPAMKQRFRHQDHVATSRDAGGGQSQIGEAPGTAVPPAFTCRDVEKAQHQPQHDKQGQLGLRPQPGEVDLGQGVKAQCRTQDGNQPVANGLEHEPSFLLGETESESPQTAGPVAFGCPPRATAFSRLSAGTVSGPGWRGWAGTRSPGDSHKTRRLRDETGSRCRARRPE